MKAICVDDEGLILARTVSLVEKTKLFDSVESFMDALEALEYLTDNKADLALLDIDMPQMSGIELATNIRKKCPDSKIIFLTGYSEYAVDAYALHANGYLLKPIGYDKLRAEIEYVLGSAAASEKTDNGQNSASGDAKKVRVETFGYFNILVDNRPVVFKRNKEKELLAFLIDRKGQFVARKDVFYILW